MKNAFSIIRIWIYLHTCVYACMLMFAKCIKIGKHFPETFSVSCLINRQQFSSVIKIYVLNDSQFQYTTFFKTCHSNSCSVKNLITKNTSGFSS